MLLFVQNLEQVSNFAFQITWSDGKKSIFALAELQKRCPCARCNESQGAKGLDSNVRAVKIFSVGNYALRILFTSGCSRGVFTFRFLRQLNLGGS